MLHTAHMQDASVSFPTTTQIRELYLYMPEGPAQWGKPLSPKQVAHLSNLLSPDEARQLTVTLRPDVERKIVFDGVEVFSLYRAVNSIPVDPDIALLYQHPLVDYHPTKLNLATRLAEIFSAAHQP